MESKFEHVKALAYGSRLNRLLHHPLRYLRAMLLKHFSSYTAVVEVKTFWGTSIAIHLPSSLDIYLTGAKTHPSEIRLTSFLMKQANTCTGFLDVGAHVGYFSLLMQKCATPQTPILAIEAAPRTFDLLQKNVKQFQSISTLSIAASNQNGVLKFLELPPKYAEYNSLQIEQYEHETWFKAINPTICEVQSRRLDELLINSEFSFLPNIIKIDVEGAELAVLEGLSAFIAKHSPILIVEFVCKADNQNVFAAIESFLAKYQLKAHAINDEGELVVLSSTIHEWMTECKYDSENIVFVK